MRLFRIIANQLAVLTLAGAILAYLHPPIFLVFANGFLWFFAATMFALGIVLDPREMRDVLGHPKRIGLGLLAQYTVMPTLGFLAARTFSLPDTIALGFILVGCAPGAMASNVIVYLAGGAVAYSVSLTTLATLFSPVVTPALVKFLGEVYLEIPFWPMLQTILLTVLLPLLTGMYVGRRLGRLKKYADQAAPAVAAISIVIICSYAVSINQARIATMAPSVLGLVIFINLSGYLIGWGLARLYGFDFRHRLALAIEIGMQNAGLGVALALRHFPPETALPGALFAVWCILTAAGASGYLRRRTAGI